MTDLLTESPPTTATSRLLLHLENGDHLHSREFLRRYEAMPSLKKAELIEGKVFMGSPVRADLHAKPDAIIHAWLGIYAARHPGIDCYANATLLLDSDNIFQPDAILCRQGSGRSKINQQGYLAGAPELIVEIAASSASIDAGEKLNVYRRCGVSEYLLWRTAERQLDWFRLENDEFIPLKPDAAGLLRSIAFEGLILNVPVALVLDTAAILAPLQSPTTI